AVCTGTPPNGLTLLAESPLRPRDLFAAVGVRRGTTYWIQVVGVEEQVVHYVLGWGRGPAPNAGVSEGLFPRPEGSLPRGPTTTPQSRVSPRRGASPHIIRCGSNGRRRNRDRSPSTTGRRAM